jgi:hypothetical protein
MTSKIIFQGLLPNSPITDKNGTKIHHDYCGNPENISPTDQCTNGLDSDALNNDYENQCAGKENCFLDLQNYIIPK